ncbi:MAG: tyrosine-type recombinase/integrase [Nevskia sp.]|nr:tyrosine-type recombinase/integrase [Nevskia sp.]
MRRKHIIQKLHQPRTHVLTAEEVEKVLAVPDVETARGLRDRAILETFYSTGVLCRELIGLKLSDVDAERRTVLIRQGRDGKARIIPIGERALGWIDKYLCEVRPGHALGRGDHALFLSHKGECIKAERLAATVAAYIDRANIGKHGSCALLRHTVKSLMLEGGADERCVQVMLGHARHSILELYSRVSIEDLQRVHADAHPAATG